jgi:CRP/FNR family transcriptional regulator, nitrogen fixation regulation protein
MSYGLAELPDQKPAEADQAPVAFRKNEIIFHQGDMALYWFEVAEGVVRTCHFRVDGNRQLTGFFFPGDVFGIEGNQYLATAQTVTSAKLMRHHSLSHPPQPDHLERALASAQQCIALFGHRTAHERLAAFILSIARKPTTNGCVPLPMSRADIADHLGLTIHTVSRTMTDIVNRGIVAADGLHRLRIIDQDQLARLAGETE